MDQTFRTVVSFVGAIVFVFGGLYLLDRYSGWRPFHSPASITEIKGSAGVLSPIGEATTQAHEASSRPPEALDRSGMPRQQIYRCESGGKTVYSDAPCSGTQSALVELNESSGVTMGVDPRDVAQFRAQALNRPQTVERRSAPAQPENTSRLREQCDLLERRVKDMDALARRPMSVSAQESIRRERKQVTDRIFELNCMKA